MGVDRADGAAGLHRGWVLFERAECKIRG
jgi:hypothetical protein